MRDPLIKKILKLAVDKMLPALSDREKECYAELRRAFQELPLSDRNGASPSASLWLSNVDHLRECVLNQSPKSFLRWRVISETMFVANAPYISTELDYLKRRPDWETRWRTAIIESPVGRPVPYRFYPASSGNLIHHAYHVAQFEEKTGIEVHNLKHVFEFGGGYGSLCRLFFNLGFNGEYIIYDLPPFSALQRYFLKSIGLPVRALDTFGQSGAGIICLSDIERLKTLLADHLEMSNSLFVATWSISEVPILVRDLVFPLTSMFGSFLISYQDRFGEVNNVEFFRRWKETYKDITWSGWHIEHVPGNYYLVGSV